MHSRKANALAILRNTLRLGQKELAALAGVSTVLIQKIEGGSRKITEDFAQTLEEQTGISKAWLLGMDVDAKPIDRMGKPYTVINYEKAQAQIRAALRHVVKPTDQPDLSVDYQHELGFRRDDRLIARLIQLHAEGAFRKGSFAYNMFCFRVERFLLQQAKKLRLETVAQHEGLVREQRDQVEFSEEHPPASRTYKGQVTIRSPSKAVNPRRSKKKKK